MRSRAALCLLVGMGAARLAHADERADGLSQPQPGVTRPRREPRPAERVVETPLADEPWQGPRVELSYARYVLSDGRGGGLVRAGSFGGYYKHERLRIGANGELGARDYSLGDADIVVRGTVLVGYQHLPALADRVVFSAMVEGTAGVVLARRFSSPQSETLRGLGLSVGAEVRLVRTLFVGLSLGYTRAALGDLAHNLLVFRVRVGL